MKVLHIALLCVLATAMTVKSLREAVGGTGNREVARTTVTVASAVPAPVTVGTTGNEPVLAVAPDGTLYISALQHFYRSTDGGATWTNPPGPPESQVNLNTDSSLSVDPNNRVYFTFDYPYAGTTAVCTSDDKGDTWACDPATTGASLSDVRPTALGLGTALPGGSLSLDRALYICSEEPNAASGRQVVVARSTDEGMTWTHPPPIPATTNGTATFSWVAA